MGTCEKGLIKQSLMGSREFFIHKPGKLMTVAELNFATELASIHDFMSIKTTANFKATSLQSILIELSVSFHFQSKMQDQIAIVTVFVAIFAIAQTTSSPLPMNGAALPPLCEPGIIEEMPAHIKKVCLALENSNQLSSALNQYIRNEAASEFSREHWGDHRFQLSSPFLAHPNHFRASF